MTPRSKPTKAAAKHKSAKPTKPSKAPKAAKASKTAKGGKPGAKAAATKATSSKAAAGRSHAAKPAPSKAASKATPTKAAPAKAPPSKAVAPKPSQSKAVAHKPASSKAVVPKAPPTKAKVVKTGDLPFPLIRQGKVRDVYDLGRGELLIVTSDRISAFDVVMEETIPKKGEVLTMLTAWWLARLETKGVEHHLISVDPEQILRMHPELVSTRKLWERRSMLVRKTEPLPIECVVRGYLAGSAWKEYLATGMLAGERLPAEMQESQRLPRPMFSPATKATKGHDENITPAEVRKVIGEQMAIRVERLSLRIYDHGRRAAEASGILLADTKFEFGRDLDGRLLLIDEVLTPDSSRFWPKQTYAAGRGQPSLDKQPLRDWLETHEWNKKAPPPKLPRPVVSATSERYLDAFRRLTGAPLSDFQPPLLGVGAP
jgi:phosphoribosylaminoimidazole-succinocarboxamide synthase